MPEQMQADVSLFSTTSRRVSICTEGVPIMYRVKMCDVTDGTPVHCVQNRY